MGREMLRCAQHDSVVACGARFNPSRPRGGAALPVPLAANVLVCYTHLREQKITAAHRLAISGATPVAPYSFGLESFWQKEESDRLFLRS